MTKDFLAHGKNSPFWKYIEECVQKELDRKGSVLLKGMCANHEDYKHQVGYLKGICWVLGIPEREAKKQEEIEPKPTRR